LFEYKEHGTNRFICGYAEVSKEFNLAAECQAVRLPAKARQLSVPLRWHWLIVAG